MRILRDEQVNEILKLLPEKFDSHAFIFEFMKKYPRDYTKELCKYKDSNDPIRIFHAEIGKLLKRNPNLNALGKNSTINVRGLHSDNEKWHKK
ncbi:hypothetical protein KAU34_02015 [candidate division WOR-3 bacterium]|nr:hypothetical protein [candidate division WOR-3 bacterium]